ncbi:MAG TPA: hypothetical protein VEZ51_04665 [Gemmatimonadaceae bacterium]|nr:hypothetical protein [Gemmatimonadaceae bacterium]
MIAVFARRYEGKDDVLRGNMATPKLDRDAFCRGQKPLRWVVGSDLRDGYEGNSRS